MAKVDEGLLAYAAGLPTIVGRGIYEEVDRRARELLGPEIRDVIAGTGHQDFLGAVAADLLDAIPGVGDLSNALRVQDAALKGEEFRRRALPAQLLDFGAGLLPKPIGDVFNALSPTNTLLYLSKLKPEGR